MRKQTTTAKPATAALDQPGRLSIGIDLGDRTSHYCVLDTLGEVVERGELRTTPEAFRTRFAAFPPSQLALEVGSHSRWCERVLRECGHEVDVANAHKLGLIFGAGQKNDRVDAEKLARLARHDRTLLFPVQHRREPAQLALTALKARDLLVRTRTDLVNFVRGVAKAAGLRLPTCAVEAFPAQAAPGLPEAVRAAVAPVLEMLDSLNERIAACEQHIEHTAETEFPDTRRLRQVRGVGAITALAFVVSVDDRDRFSSSRAVGCWLGLQPRQDQSGARSPELGITKAGDGFLRRLLVQSAQRILGPFGEDSDLRRWGLKLAERGGQNAKKRAVVAVARKLATLLHRLWVTQADYVPLRTAVAEELAALRVTRYGGLPPRVWGDCEVLLGRCRPERPGTRPQRRWQRPPIKTNLILHRAINGLRRMRMEVRRTGP